MPGRIMHGQIGRPPLFLREWREHRQLTQQQLADRLDTTAASISRIESGKRDFTGVFLIGAARALGCQPADLIGRLPTEPSLDAAIKDAPAAVKAQIRIVVEALLKPTA